MINTVLINSKKQDQEKLISVLSADREIQILASGKDGYDAIKLVSSLKPDIAILDNHLELINGEEISPVLKVHSPLTAVVILVSRISDTQLLKAASNEISGFVHTETDMNILPQILRRISSIGGCYISPVIASRVLHLLSLTNSHIIKNLGSAANKPFNKASARQKIMLLSGENPTGTLSRSELRILTCIAEGYESTEIAGKLHLAVGTVRNYISSVMRKTGLHNRSQIALYAFWCGIAPISPEGFSETMYNSTAPQMKPKAT